MELIILFYYLYIYITYKFSVKNVNIHGISKNIAILPQINYMCKFRKLLFLI